VRVRLRTGLVVVALALAIVFAFAGRPLRAATPGPACGEQLVKSDKGIQIKVLFARNGAVQRYLVLTTHKNVEDATDLRLDLEKHFGPAGIDAPPLQIVSFRPGSGGLQIPDKAIDSCGRKLSFQ
jgi:hypothetical protein